MPEHFTDTLGNWNSRAKETYRRTTLTKAQAQFCGYLGAPTVAEKEQAHRKNFKASTQKRMTDALEKIHGSATHDKRKQLREALQLMHKATRRRASRQD